MCGIVGFIGSKNAKDVLLNGLEKLEYRGYDSAGIALLNHKEVYVVKEKGRIADLSEKVAKDAFGEVGIGHTRWATHGKPSHENAHPHQSTSGRFTMVHNGVIENYSLLKEEYLKEATFISDTDTEVIVQLVEKFVEEGLTTESALRKTLSLLHGSYAISLIDKEDSQTLYAAKSKSPLLIGKGEGFNVIASDAMAALKETDQFIEIMDGEMVILTRSGVQILSAEGEEIERAAYTATIDATDIEKGTYPHYMLKEIDEQPAVTRRIIQSYQNEDGDLTVEQPILDAILEADRVHIIACGTSYHAGLVGKNLIEKLAHIPVEVHVSSEFGYNMPLLSERPLFLFITQSGETADSRQVLVKVKEMGYKTLTLTNVSGSTLDREADHAMYLFAGPEIAVASTKAYTAQIAVLSILAVTLGREKGIVAAKELDLAVELGIVATAMEAMVASKELVEHIAGEFLATTRNAFFLGRSVDYFVAMEAALKLKEISYIQAEGFASGELKHGTIALIEDETPVLAIVTQENINWNIRGNVNEVLARGANACVFAMEGLEQPEDRLVIPHVHPLLTSLASVIPCQLLAYYAALHRECDVDKPRNLAKSVTVE
ncbi:glutamine--fructose-6-phosphate transaminase (isomerizing) [Listeria fleischmannii]|uniref:Glutamine--fructose-6-phosphate aminotransferase [isomerizing] n=1 Tax=Listeria fleischmannii TaxID=1069827 RepID=A0A841YDL5_9LIST|nr:glutamine--fructose-6-phosphate transaminase (isomerizing) [Listeria fleischmannii]EIA19145.1 glucosamine--fructose-6-phosphate aminotransferase [Listeria fleischmannii subsp. coloradonensis]MBC1398320.1 glutamine--fructose-6-phosphate transaminase (isomerizing) [Listeria fleischmannii]MBC1426381.1 glutamine--fructose-6-phosphate transaminase (isomerizing) [Listeria fleischmannii]STY35650.1 Glucosamine--fructose-6-phosphate aminotransferase [isomerizing] [Listeria fleischmannii subsp. colora